MNTLGVNDFAKNSHTPAKGSHYAGTWDELIAALDASVPLVTRQRRFLVHESLLFRRSPGFHGRVIVRHKRKGGFRWRACGPRHTERRLSWVRECIINEDQEVFATASYKKGDE